MEKLINSADSSRAGDPSLLPQIFHSAPVGMGLVRDQVIQEVNPLLCQLTGYSRDELLGRSARSLYSTKEEFERVERECQTQLEARGRSALETRWRHSDGSEVALLLYCSTLFAGDPGQGLVYSTINPAETPQGARQQELRSTQEQLWVSQKLEAVGRLAGGVAHDFNNILGAILCYTDVLMQDLQRSDPLWEDVEQIAKSAERAASLTRQLLAFSRRQVLEAKVLNLNDVVADLDRMLHRLIGEDIELLMELDPELGLLRADVGQVEQVLVNLVVNSRDAMPGVGQLTIETHSVELDLRRAGELGLEQPGKYVLLKVSDTGNGMDEDTRTRIFEPFFTTKEIGKGTGLGLSTVYGIVTQSGGAISVESEPGQGTTFNVFFPLVEDVTEEERDLQRRAVQVPAGTETLLVAEDEDTLRRLMVRMLKRGGYNVLEARHGGEALLTCEQYQETIHLLVTDVVMPQMGGRQLAQRLAPLRPEMKVLYTSGYTNDTIVQHGMTEKGPAFLQKPFTSDDLLARVRRVLDS